MTTEGEQRSVGNITAAALGFGCMSLTPGFYGGSKENDFSESEAVLRKALESDRTLLSTADCYTGFAAGEELCGNLKFIGKVLKDYPRSSVVIASKWGPYIEPGKGFTALDLTPETCKRKVDDQLQYLGTDYIDILILRLGVGPCSKGTPLEETAKAMKEVLQSGKVKAIGVSECTLAEAKAVHSVVPVSVIEVEWSLFNRENEEDIIPWARSIGAGILAFSPMARGLLTGNLDMEKLPADDVRKIASHLPQFHKDNVDENIKLVGEVQKLAKAKGCTAGQLALAWVLAQGTDVIPIPGTKRLKYLEENLKARNVILTAAEISQLSNVIPRDKKRGTRVVQHG